MKLADISLSNLKGVGEKRRVQLSKLGLGTIFDLLFFYPRDYMDRSVQKKIIETLDGDSVLIKARVISNVKEITIKRQMTLCETKIEDETGVLKVIWFNQSFIKHKLKKGMEYSFFGKIDGPKSKVLTNPTFEEYSCDSQNFMRILPIYSSLNGLGQSFLRKIITQALQEYSDHLETKIPKSIIQKYHLADFKTALQTMHAPKDLASLEKSRNRLVFEELFVFHIKLLQLKERNSQTIKKRSYKNLEGEISSFMDQLPFALTHAQQRALQEIFSDMESKKIMNRMVQGDVGCGKTIVAAIAILKAVKSDFQAMMMAPTSVLAEQHYHELKSLFKNLNIRVSLLTGSMKKKEKDQIKNDLQKGSIQVVVGTHALIQKDVFFQNLALVITDEQHRFGVHQRGTAIEKGLEPDVLVMSATPIPRTLAIILYGDLDISIIDEMPKGRIPVETYIVKEDMRERLIHFIKKNILEGGQAFIVCPLIDESEKLDTLKSAVALWEEYHRNDFKGYRIGLLHGKMSSEEKDDVIHNFSTGHTQILLSTTVIEVGVNVPNANIMVVENAERFGLSQLHQLRGRVGRGLRKSYCILFNQSESDVSSKRLEILKTSNDGFEISQKDLDLRGPGDFFGTKQHGLPSLKLANLIDDIKVLKEVQSACQEVLLSGEMTSFDEEREFITL
jgi:ATP-dependent DNA helicase RecG